MLSIKIPWRTALSFIKRDIKRDCGICAINPIASITPIAVNGIQAIGPPIKLIIQIKKKAKGRSDNTVVVAEVINSRRLSRSRIWFAITPVEAGRFISFMPIT